MDADDLYCNYHILKFSYETCVQNKLDLLQFDFYGGSYDGNLKFDTTMISGTKDKSRYNMILTQPEIRFEFYHSTREDLMIDGLVYDKLYSKELIKRMADAMGEECWKHHLIYMEDYIIILAAAREAKTFMCIPFGGVWHWYWNPDGMTQEVFELQGDELKRPKETNKKLGDNLYVFEKCFDMTEDDPTAETLRMRIIDLFQKPDNRHVYAKVDSFETILVLCKRLIEWKYSTDKGISFAKSFGKGTINFVKDPKKKEFYKKKYYMFKSEDDDIDEIFGS